MTGKRAGRGLFSERRRRRRGWRRGSCSLMGFTVQRCRPKDAADTRRFMDEFLREVHAAEPRRGAAPIRRLPPRSRRGIIRAAVKRHQEDAVARYVYAHLIRPFGNHLEDAEVTAGRAAMASVVKTLLERFHCPSRPASLSRPGPRPQRREVPAYRRAEGELMDGPRRDRTKEKNHDGC